ncbi:MAG: RNA polymerase sigma-70 factor [Candidatus Pseudobacter hemicellulosilyticus]|uniref:RNA polymerase sigma-70 factor n=1 Tax=Candidatus Pseudobacter hemicellulosilyticus TaxID=3121375 RepID=A0AAJ5WUJ5_9BACT|nr:MAG: RNA polymerase sigma-70 factor [Pseudobacter sp.]
MSDNTPNTETVLLERLAQNDEDAFAELYRRYHPKLYFFVLNFTGNQQAAEDALQEVFVKLWAERASLTGITNFNAWIFRVAKNHVLNGLRRMAHETLILAEIAKDITAGTPEPLQLLGYKDAYAVLHAGIAELPQQQQRVLLLSREEGLKYEEIGALLNISPLTVKKHAAEALRFLRDRFKKHYALPSLLILLRNFF